MSESITLAGRSFRPVGASTFRHQLWMMPHLLAVGLARPVADGDEFTARVFAAGPERTLLLLGGALEEVGVPWTPAGADANAQFFGDLSDPTDLLTLHDAMVRVLLDFFASGIASASTSPGSSAGPVLASPVPPVPPAPASSTASSGAPAPLARRPRRRRSRSEPAPATGAASTSASGATSSAPSPTTTPPASP